MLIDLLKIYLKTNLGLEISIKGNCSTCQGRLQYTLWCWFCLAIQMVSLGEPCLLGRPGKFSQKLNAQGLTDILKYESDQDDLTLSAVYSDNDDNNKNCYNNIWLLTWSEWGLPFYYLSVCLCWLFLYSSFPSTLDYLNMF